MVGDDRGVVCVLRVESRKLEEGVGMVLGLVGDYGLWFFVSREQHHHYSLF